ncbi:DUF4013 domain-containing protein [Halonotius terrestris]|uniref:DUF4013 domain-containing protein n=1 Tax=Halonotius terrestris TaxID=2487750 RepID=A0A8J8PCA9_9EURY|nr:DUF4013 domain-containing protein [Halonotius terrestris]TQQ82618.1 DUF4013 domain-containing protein [Halonotius terrestris]
MLSEALRLPYRAADATGTLLVGSVLTGVTWIALVGWAALLAVAPRVGAAVTPVVFLLSLVVRGYLLEVVAGGINGDPSAPSFVHWGSLLRNGAKSAVVSAIYFLPAAVFIGLAGGAGAATVIDPPGFEGALQAIAALAILVGGFGTLCYGLVYLYLRGAARAVLAATGSARAALNVRRTFRLSLSGSYLGGWLVAMGLLTVGPVLLLPLVVVSGLAGLYDPVLTAIGGLLTLLLAVVLLFSLRMSAAWATGRGAAPSLAIDDTTAVDDDNDEVIPEPETEPSRPPEVAAAVQVGRTVGQHSEAVGADQRSIDFGMAGMPRPNSRRFGIENGAMATNGATPDDDQPRETEIDADETEIDADETETDGGNERENNDDTDDDGFEWGVVEEA